VNVFEQLGGEPFFTALVARFYERVAHDPVLAPMYPDDDFPGAERRLRLFLMQYWGGPQTYSAERGHPRLRMRHQPFAIDEHARERWLANMDAALEQTIPEHVVDPTMEVELRRYLHSAALAMVNTWPERDDLPMAHGGSGSV
jgi:hemoglobin